MPTIHVETHWRPKAGNALDEYEDASAVRPSSGRRPFRCAVADGATETSFSRLWAELLVAAYCAGDLTARRWGPSLSALQARWWEDLRHRHLPWYAEEKSRAGAFAALVGLTLRSEGLDSMRWSALAIGDSCLLHVRDGAILTSFPLTSAADFGRSPALLSSNPAANVRIRPLARSGTAHVGDQLVLATDALACSLLTLDGRPVELRETLGGLTSDQFDLTVDHMRAQHKLRNDDVTLVRVTVA